MGSAPLKTGRSTLPAEMAFHGNWRTYQARLLERLDSYLEDKRLHIVAAPGSGKTVFGLEAIRRIGRPTLVLAPTITIRNQWAERLVQYFLPHESPKPDWVSTNIRRPELLTIATYQALHALCSGEPEETEDACAEEETNSTFELPYGNGKGTGTASRQIDPLPPLPLPEGDHEKRVFDLSTNCGREAITSGIVFPKHSLIKR